MDPKPRTLDEVMDDIGGFGSFQRRMLLLIGAAVGVAGMCSLSFLFVGRQPGGTAACRGAARRLLPPAEARPPAQSVPAPPYMPSYGDEFGMVCDRGWLLTLSSSVFFLGNALGSYWGGRMADSASAGRRACAVHGLLGLGLAHAAMALAPCVAALLAARTAVGFWAGVVMAGAWPLAMELVPSARRADVGGWLWVLWSAWVGSNAVIAYAVERGGVGAWLAARALPCWRAVSLAIAAPSLLLWAAVAAAGAATPAPGQRARLFWVPESPHFLLPLDARAAAGVLAAIAQVNGRSSGGGGGGGGGGGSGSGGGSGGGGLESEAGVAALTAELGAAAGGYDDDATQGGSGGASDSPAGIKVAKAKAKAKAKEVRSLTVSDLFGAARVHGVPVRALTVGVSYLWFACTAVYYGLSISISGMAGSVYVRSLTRYELLTSAFSFSSLPTHSFSTCF